MDAISIAVGCACSVVGIWMVVRLFRVVREIRRGGV